MEEASQTDVDVAIVGYGPVGQALAAWLGAAGHTVTCIERFTERYRLPRAVHLDHEIMRLLGRLGVAERLAPQMISFDEYHWFGMDGETLMVMRPESPSISGLEPDWLFFQPDLEDALDARARSFAGVSLEQGWVARSLEQDSDGATITLGRAGTDGAAEEAGGERTVRARWVIGADGANSLIREELQIARRDLGFQERWFVVDVLPDELEALDLPTACQWCDPRRPTTHVRSGIGHRRWEFMLLPGESAEEFDEARAWELLAPWFTPRDGRLLRHAVYEFRSVLAERLRDGRVLIAGDAAHLTPPFLGQGLCSGLRDAANIAWKLDLVLRELAREELLDTVGPERQPQNEWIIAFAVELGKVLCELDPDRARERDEMVRGAETPPPIGLPALGAGAIREGDALAGTLSLQGRLEIGGRSGLLDELAGGGFTLICTAEAAAALGAPQARLLERLGARVVRLGEQARDLDGRTTAWLGAHGLAAVLVRPDLYVYGSAAEPAEVPALVEALAGTLGMPREPVGTGRPG